MVTWVTRSNQSPIASLKAVTSSSVRANSLVRIRENATMLFAAVSDDFASVVCSPNRFSVMLLVPCRNHCTPALMEVRGVEPLSKISVAPPTCLLKSHTSGLGVKNTLPAIVDPVPPLNT